MFEYDEDIQDFVAALQDFIAQYELPEQWFNNPDHIAIKCADDLDYVYKLEELVPDAQQTTQIEMDGRRLASLLLISPQPVGQNWQVSWLELMEPRPEKVGKDIVGLEHMEFCYPDFDEIKEILDMRAVPYTEQSNSGHAWINIVINSAGQELKLNNKPLADIIEEELEEGIAQIL